MWSKGAAARCALDEAKLQKVRFVELLNRRFFINTQKFEGKFHRFLIKGPSFDLGEVSSTFKEIVGRAWSEARTSGNLFPSVVFHFYTYNFGRATENLCYLIFSIKFQAKYSAGETTAQRRRDHSHTCCRGQ